MITESQKIINFDKSGLSTAMLNILIFKMSRIGMFKKVSTYSKGIKIWKKGNSPLYDPYFFILS